MNFQKRVKFKRCGKGYAKYEYCFQALLTYYVFNQNKNFQLLTERFNEAGVEMLPGWLHEKIFPDNSSNVPVQAEVVEIALKHLEHQGLKGKKTENFPNVSEFDIQTFTVAWFHRQ